VTEVRISAVLVILLLLLGLYYTLQPPAPSAAPLAAPSLAEAAGTCFGYTARLRLVRETPAVADLSSSILHNVVWDLEIAGPVALEQAASGTASLYTFASRSSSGERTRRDLGQLQWAGSGQQLAQRGRVVLEPPPGGFQDGDQSSLYAWIDLPGGAMELQGLTFRLQAGADQLGAAVAQAAPQATCHPPSQG
jgi:hypothetical protein